MTEQTVAGLLGLSQLEDRLGEWQRAWDEIEDMHLEDEGVPADADAAFQRKRPDAWAVSWDNLKLSILILEFTRPNDRVPSPSKTLAHTRFPYCGTGWRGFFLDVR